MGRETFTLETESKLYLYSKHCWCGEAVVWELQGCDRKTSITHQEVEDAHLPVQGCLVCQCELTLIEGEGIDLVACQHVVLQGRRGRMAVARRKRILIVEKSLRKV